MVHYLQSLSKQTSKKEVFIWHRKIRTARKLLPAAVQAVRAARSMEKKHMVRRSFRRIQEVLSSM